MPDFQDDTIPSTKTVDYAVAWVRFLLPFAIGAVGLYVGLIIAPMESRLKQLETEIQVCTAHVIKDSQIMQEFERRLTKTENAMEAHKLRDHNRFCEKDDLEDVKLEFRRLTDQFSRFRELHHYNNSISPIQENH